MSCRRKLYASIEESYRVPEDLEFLIRILVEALALGNASTSVGRR
jgi:hypothetical protein